METTDQEREVLACVLADLISIYTLAWATPPPPPPPPPPPLFPPPPPPPPRPRVFAARVVSPSRVRSGGCRARAPAGPAAAHPFWRLCRSRFAFRRACRRPAGAGARGQQGALEGARGRERRGRAAPGRLVSKSSTSIKLVNDNVCAAAGRRRQRAGAAAGAERRRRLKKRQPNTVYTPLRTNSSNAHIETNVRTPTFTFRNRRVSPLA